MLESLEKDMRMAHMTQIPKKYFVQSVLQAGCFAVIFAIAVFLLRHALTLPIPFLYDIPEFLRSDSSRCLSSVILYAETEGIQQKIQNQS